jgi:hypothetical protein
MWNGGRNIGAVAREVAERASALTKLELELATLEVKKKALAFSVGVGLGAGAVVFAVLGICFALATGTAALTLAFSVWVSLLIMTGALFLVAGVLGILAARKLRGGAPPVPEAAIREAKTTTEAIKR